MSKPEHAEVLVIGAGIAGLIAARDLAAGGVRCLLLEAQDRIGGRIRTERDNDGAVAETGAEFVHGKPPALLEEIRRAKLKLEQRDLKSYRSAHGTIVPEEFDNEGESIFERLENFSGEDQSFFEFLKSVSAAEPLKEQVKHYVEGFNAAKAERISTLALARQQRAEDWIDGDALHYIDDGYDQLPHKVFDQIDKESCGVALDSCVSKVVWRKGEVVAHGIQTGSGSFEAHARAAIITVPLPCLQLDNIAFEPPLTMKKDALNLLEMGDAVLLTLRFREAFWSRRAPDLGFLFAEDTQERSFPVFWSNSKQKTPMLTAWASGRRAEALQELSAAELTRLALGSLARIFDLGAAEIEGMLLSSHFHDWARDPYALGAYSYVLTGGIEAQRELAAPVEKTLFFAGEHTESEGHHATVHGAMTTGKRAAAEVFSVLQSRAGRQ